MENTDPFTFIHPDHRQRLRDYLYEFDMFFKLRNAAIDEAATLSFEVFRLTNSALTDTGYGANMILALEQSEKMGKANRKIKECQKEIDDLLMWINFFLRSRQLEDFLFFNPYENKLTVIRDDPETIYLD